VVELFRLIDWMMELPPVLKELFWEDVDKIQEERKMPFISTPEWVGFCRGLRKGIEGFLKFRFGVSGLQLMPEIREIRDEDQLDAILNALQTGASLDEVRGMCKSNAPETGSAPNQLESTMTSPDDSVLL
jgi:hypothetical protein